MGPRHVPGAHQDAARGQPRDPDTAPPVIRPTPELPETHRDAARGHRNTTGKPCSQLQSPDTAPFITRPAPELPGAHQDIARSQPRDPDTAQPNIGPAPDTALPTTRDRTYTASPSDGPQLHQHHGCSPPWPVSCPPLSRPLPEPPPVHRVWKPTFTKDIPTPTHPQFRYAVVTLA